METLRKVGPSEEDLTRYRAYMYTYYTQAQREVPSIGIPP
jgi:hypothetical protein